MLTSALGSVSRLEVGGGLPLAGLDALVYGIAGVTLGSMGANVGEHFAGRRSSKAPTVEP